MSAFTYTTEQYQTFLNMVTLCCNTRFTPSELVDALNMFGVENAREMMLRYYADVKPFEICDAKKAHVRGSKCHGGCGWL